MSSLRDQISELETKLILKRFQQKELLTPSYMAKIRAKAKAQRLSDKAYLERLRRILKEGG